MDFFNPAAAAFFWRNLSARLLSLGVDAWWLDATEPENDDLEGRTTRAGPGEKMRNVYPLFVTKTVYEGQRNEAPDRRVLILTRSAFPGVQRYAAATWSGDIGCDWDAFRRQIPAGLGYMMTGMPWWTTDCGGFFRPGPGQFTDPDYQERFIRWFQFATFCPLQRVHGYQTDTEPWRYGPTVEEHVHRFLDLRYRLLPYIYSEAARVTFDGSTLMRPLVMDFPDDPLALAQEHQYMFGPALLVSPVLKPGAAEWDVYLPNSPGGWIDFWTGDTREGGCTAKSPAPLDRIPVHARAGSIVPLGPCGQYSGEMPPDPIELRVYAGADARFILYEDDGVTYGYENGARATIPMDWNEGSQTLTIGTRQGSFPGLRESRTMRIVWVRPGRGVGIAPVGIADAEVRYDGAACAVRRP